MPLVQTASQSVGKDSRQAASNNYNGRRLRVRGADKLSAQLTFAIYHMEDVALLGGQIHSYTYIFKQYVMHK